jgi:uncharacterized protein YfdQ (DUF2303 family)
VRSLGDLSYNEGDNVSDAGIVADLALKSAGVVAQEGHVYALADGTIVDLDRHAIRPWRPRGTAKPQSVEALIAYVTRHRTEETTIWVEPLNGHVVAVLNDNGAAQAEAWRDLRADLTLPTTPEWDHWLKRDGDFLDQATFAEHVEDGIDEVRDPSAADLLEVSQTMQATVTADFRSASRLHDGSIVAAWAEHVDARAGAAGDLTIPKEIVLALTPFYGEQPYAVSAKIRYRIRSGTLAIGYKLDRPESVVRDCLNAIKQRLVESFGDVVYTGIPAPPQEPGSR